MMLSAVALCALACILTPPLQGAETLTPVDANFCQGGLEVIYPELTVRDCMVVPSEAREKISREWGDPLVRLTSAHEKRTYVLLMVDPDAPSRSSPTRAFWRHWVVADIKGDSLKKGQIKGTVLTRYSRPTPPRGSGLHRYQFLLYRQPAAPGVSLSCEEGATLGNWDLEAFVGRFGLGEPVATLQFLTQNYKD